MRILAVGITHRQRVRGLTKSFLVLTVAATHAFAIADVDTWEYQTKRDPMTDKPTIVAQVASKASLNLSFPYQGTNWTHLLVRAKGKSPAEVMVLIDKGQMLCRSYAGGCTFQVRFDSDPPITFSASGPSDGSAIVAFLKPADRFITGARKAKNIKVAFELYRQGPQMAEFGPLVPLQWPPK